MEGVLKLIYKYRLDMLFTPGLIGKLLPINYQIYDLPTNLNGLPNYRERNRRHVRRFHWNFNLIIFWLNFVIFGMKIFC